MLKLDIGKMKTNAGTKKQVVEIGKEPWHQCCGKI
jgi:hypothetical protein